LENAVQTACESIARDVKSSSKMYERRVVSIQLRCFYCYHYHYRCCCHYPVAVAVIITDTTISLSLPLSLSNTPPIYPPLFFFAAGFRRCLLLLPTPTEPWVLMPLHLWLHCWWNSLSSCRLKELLCLASTVFLEALILDLDGV
jgi:hypothetical protein